MKKQFKVAIASMSMIACIAPFSFTLTSCSKNGIVFANYESYIADNIIKKYQKTVQFLNYSTSEEIGQKFENNYDAAVPSMNGELQLMKDDELSIIDWSKFNLYNYMNLDGFQTIDARYTEWGTQIKTGIEAEGLLSNGGDTGVNLASGSDAFGELDKWAYDEGYFPDWYANNSVANAPEFFENITGKLTRVRHNNDKREVSLLDFCIPYVLQSLMFSYKGSYLGTKDPNTWVDDSWDKMINWTAEESPDHQSRFYGGGDNKGKIYMVDDTRTMYDTCKLYDDKENSTSVDINPAGAPDYNADSQSIIAYKSTYGEFANNYKKGSHQFVLNSDSGELCSAYGKGTGANGFLSYNVDVMAVGTGNGERQNEKYMTNGWVNDYDNWMGGDYGHRVSDANNNDPDGYTYEYPDFGNFMNVLNPSQNIMCYDMIVFNKRIQNNKAKEQKLYDFINDFAIKGIGWFKPDDQYGNDKPIFQYKDSANGDYSYYYDIMNNFDWNLGVSPWNSVNAYILGENLNDQVPYDNDSGVSDAVWDHYEDYYEENELDPYNPEWDEDGFSYFESCTDDLINEYRPDFYESHPAPAGEDTTVCSNWVSFLDYCYMIKASEGTPFSQLTELPLNNLSKSNMHWGWESVKDRL